MREPLLQSRRAHYLGLVGLLVGMTLGGAVTLRCGSASVVGGSLVPKEGVKTSSESGIEFDKNVGTADYDLDAMFERNGEDVTCTWKAVKSLEPMRSAVDLDDFTDADSSSVEMTGNRATIKVNTNRIRRSVFFVCQYQVGPYVRLRSHTVRVQNNF